MKTAGAFGEGSGGWYGAFVSGFQVHCFKKNSTPFCFSMPESKQRSVENEAEALSRSTPWRACRPRCSFWNLYQLKEPNPAKFSLSLSLPLTCKGSRLCRFCFCFFFSFEPNMCWSYVQVICSLFRWLCQGEFEPRRLFILHVAPPWYMIMCSPLMAC